MPFVGGGESHEIFVEILGADAVVMIHSRGEDVADWLTDRDNEVASKAVDKDTAERLLKEAHNLNTETRKWAKKAKKAVKEAVKTSQATTEKEEKGVEQEERALAVVLKEIADLFDDFSLLPKAAVRGKKPPAPAAAGKGADSKESTKTGGSGEEHDEKLAEGLRALDAVTARYVRDGATKGEIKTGVKSVRRKFTIFKSIEVIDGGDTWDYRYVFASKRNKERSKEVSCQRGTRYEPKDIGHYSQSRDYQPSRKPRT